jgi:predicted RecA/RadA family phage recombinase
MSEPQNLRSGWAFSATLALAGLAWAGLAWAQNGAGFSGFYHYSDVSVSGDTASPTLTLRLVNHSGIRVSNATVLVRDPVIRGLNYGSFANVNIPAGQTVLLSGIFQIPQREYQNWRLGRTPSLIIDYTDAAGNHVRRPIEIARDPVRQKAP